MSEASAMYHFTETSCGNTSPWVRVLDCTSMKMQFESVKLQLAATAASAATAGRVNC